MNRVDASPAAAATNNGNGNGNTSLTASATAATAATAPSASSPSPPATDDLEHKLHAVAASFRQKRDAAHRAYQLATERLRLVTEECSAAEATVATATQHLAKQQRQWRGNGGSGGGATCGTGIINDDDDDAAGAPLEEQAALQREVEQLTKEVHFRHQELLLKRGKLVDQRAAVSGPAERDAALTKLRAAVAQRRRLRAAAAATGVSQQPPQSLRNFTPSAAAATSSVSPPPPPMALVEEWKDHCRGPTLPRGVGGNDDDTALPPMPPLLVAAVCARWSQCLAQSAAALRDATPSTPQLGPLERVVAHYQRLLRDDTTVTPPLTTTHPLPLGTSLLTADCATPTAQAAIGSSTEAIATAATTTTPHTAATSHQESPSTTTMDEGQDAAAAAVALLLVLPQ